MYTVNVEMADKGISANILDRKLLEQVPLGRIRSRRQAEWTGILNQSTGQI